MVLGISKIAFRLRDWHVLCDNNVFSTLPLKNFSEKCKPYWKNWSTVFLLKVLRLKKQHFHTKLLCQKPVLRQIEWGVQGTEFCQ